MCVSNVLKFMCQGVNGLAYTAQKDPANLRSRLINMYIHNHKYLNAC